MREIIVVIVILLVISSPLWMWVLGMMLNQEWMLYPIAWCMRAIFWMGGYRS